MMETAVDAEGGGDVENPTPKADPTSAAGGRDPHRKWKVGLSAILVAAVVLAIALGVTLGGGQGDGGAGDGGADASLANINAEEDDKPEPTPTQATCLVGDIMYNEGDSVGHIGLECVNETSYDASASTCGPDGEIVTTETQFSCGGSVPYCVQCGPRGRGAALCLSTPTTDRDCGDSDSTPADPSPTDPSPTDPSDTTSGGEAKPQVWMAKMLRSKGPILTEVKQIDPGAANGYASCSDLEGDILRALEHYANTVILRESKHNNWYEKCDPNNPGRPWYGIPIAEPAMLGGAAESLAFDAAPAADTAAAAAPPTAGKVDGASAQVMEDSFGTNNQVEGVDEADVTKSDGVNVYAAYGDVLFVWPAANGTEGMSITKMPYDSADDDCNVMPPYMRPEPMPLPAVMAEEDAEIFEDSVSETVAVEPDRLATSGAASSASAPSSGGGRKLRNRQREDLSIAPGWGCGNRKPRIVSLLLEGPRLTAIVSENRGRRWYEKNDGPQPIIDDSSKLTLRIYDVSEGAVPTNGGALTLVGEREMKGDYHSARSFDNTGFVITKAHVNTHMFAEDLYRHQPQYCGLNSSEYEELAAETALNNTKPFMERMIEELQLQGDGTCSSIFQVAAMQSGDSTEIDRDNLIDQYVQVSSFDMSAPATLSVDTALVSLEIPTKMAAAFSSGWLSQVYASQNFAATVNVGSRYNPEKNSWDSSTFLLGFDTSGDAPMPFSYAEIPGEPLNQYSVDLHDGHLRVVTTETDWVEVETNNDMWSSMERVTTNKIYVLGVPGEKYKGQEMELVGVSDSLGKPGESVFAARFIGDRAYIVTFERTDPFYIYDMSNHSKPVKLGELEIPGFSSYLHPVEIDGIPFMLGVGEHVDPQSGRRVGVKISLFDISDDANPKENATLVDDDAYSSAGHDFYSFRYLPLLKKLILPKSEYTWSDKGNFDGFVVYDVDIGSIAQKYEIPHVTSYDMYHGCWYRASMPPRSFVFQSKLTTVLSHSVISTDLRDGAQLWNVSLDEKLNVTNNCQPYFYY